MPGLVSLCRYNSRTGESSWERPKTKLQALVKTGFFNNWTGGDTGGGDTGTVSEETTAADGEAAGGDNGGDDDEWEESDDGAGNKYWQGRA